jgi:peptidoglycan/xylan/chitin deacetylase (PgdA/CDA1 family)
MKWNILCYHTVDPEQADVFARQLQWFRNCEGYEFRSFRQAFAERTHRRHGKWMTVSFDDGDWTVSTVAQKVLDDEGIRAILYLTTDYVLQGRTYRAGIDRPAITWEQLGRWIEAGHEIGSHTHTHVNLTKCEAGQWMEELNESRRIIEQRLGVVPRHFAYPWGQYNDETLRWFHSQAEWLSAALVLGRFNRRRTDSFLLRRNSMTAVWDQAALNRVVRCRIARGFHRMFGSLLPCSHRALCNLNPF